MFLVAELKDHVKIKSRQIDSDIMQSIETVLKNSYENKILGRINGYVIQVHKINKDIKKGTLGELTGDINYYIEYIASVFIPRPKHLLDIIITSNDDGEVVGIPFLIGNKCDVSVVSCICKKDLGPGSGSENEEEYCIQEIGTKHTMYIVNVEVKYHKIVIIGYIV